VIEALREEWSRLRDTFRWYSGATYLTGWAWLRASIDRHLFRCNEEHCFRCGARVEAVWWCLDRWTWEASTGHRNGAGLRCIRCFDREAQRAGLPVFFLALDPEEFDRQVRARHVGRAG